uniref:NADH-ubiquinone oxidoreductase chain 5 n=1 Tax=Coleoptera sp. ACP-2013 TaxID=2485033 RepID=A0A3G3MEN1_9COLE|nr:NADH dehydrogenase subunit 5 [Coleoptera sp. ACP-2013]
MFKNFSILMGILSLVFFFYSISYSCENYIIMLIYSFLNLNSWEMEMSIYFDWMTFLFMSFVCLISSMVLFYSQGYMSGEKNKMRFCYLVVLFVFSMMFMIISPNLISILLGWDGLGLVSYCLVIYYQNIKSFNAGMLTALTNRVGDVAILMAIAWMINLGGWNYVFYLELIKVGEFSFISVLIIIAAWTKSAQIPFSSWLPAAMAAPTPVSSLVHSSTLVTAGVYLLIRFNISFSSEMLKLMLFLSLFTMFMSGVGANFEFDLKKIIALSTLSQLGLMMSILALGEYKLAFYHLLIHAIFKALLFMCAGNFIHNFINCQDIRFMGGMILFMPLTSSYFNISNLSLCGLPFLSGFYSKDLIVEVMSMNYLNLFVYAIFYISIGLTVAYSARLSYYVLFGEFNFISCNSINDESKEMLKGMSGLILWVVFSGSTVMWLVFPEPFFIYLPVVMKLMTLFMILIGAFLGYEMSKFEKSYQILSKKWFKFGSFSSLMWNMPIISTLGVNLKFLILGNYIIKVIDQGWSEFYGAKNLKFKFSVFSSFLQLIFSNHIKIYFIFVTVWVCFIFYIF